MSKNYYDVALICLNGHVVNDASTTYPDYNKKFCDQCGQQTINACQTCGEKIQGHYHMEHVSYGSYDRPAFCHECGHAYPWTEAALLAARELAEDLDTLNPEEKESLKHSLDDIVRDTPRTSVAVTRLKKYLAKAGDTAASGFKTILINVATEAAKKMLWP